MLDITLMRIMTSRDTYLKTYRAVPSKGLDDKTTTVLKAFGRYFAEFPDHEKIEIPTFMSVFFNFYHKDLDDTNRVFYERIIKGLNVEVDEQTKATMIDRLSEVDYSMQAAQLLQDYADGKDFDLIHSLSELTDKVKAQLEKRVKIPWVNDPIEELLVEDEQDGGLHWRLPCLNESMRPLRGGDFGIIAGRPDSGKTTRLRFSLVNLRIWPTNLIWSTVLSLNPDIFSGLITKGRVNVSLLEDTKAHLESLLPIWWTLYRRSGSYR
jgi:replicative DNA helicase